MMRTLLLAFALVACDDAPPPPAEPTAPPAEAPPAPEAAPAPAPASTNPDAPRVPTRTTSRMAASHILVAYAEALRAEPSVTRTRAEAKAKAEELHQKLTAGADFAALARTDSDDSSGKRGGSLGSFGPGKMVKEFDDAVAALPVGGLSAVVETPFGFHVIRRDEVVEVHCAQLMVGFAGAEKPLPGVTRGKDDARKRIEAAKAELDAGGEWKVVVRKYTDGPTKEDGGDLGWFSKRQLMPALDAVAFDLDIGATSEIVESPTAFHLVRRLE